MLPGCFTLPETNIAPENGWLEVSFWNSLFSGAMLVSGRVSQRNVFQVETGQVAIVSPEMFKKKKPIIIIIKSPWASRIL